MSATQSEDERGLDGFIYHINPRGEIRAYDTRMSADAWMTCDNPQEARP